MAKNLIPVDLEDSTPDNTIGGLPDIPDDDYLFQVEALESDVDDNDRRWYKVTAFIVSDCPYRGTTFTEKFTFPADSTDDYSKKGRDRFHAWLLAVGYDVSKRKFGINPDKLRGEKFWSRTYHHKMPASADGRFEERTYSRMGPFSPEDDEAVKRMSSKLPAKARGNDDDDDEDVKPTKPLSKVVDEDEEDEVTAKRREKAKKAKAAAKDDDDDDEDDDERPIRRRRPAEPDDDDDDDEDEDEKPAKKGKKAEKPAKSTKKSKAKDEDEDDDDDDDEEDVFPTRPAKGAKVEKAAKGKPRRSRNDDDDDDDDD